MKRTQFYYNLNPDGSVEPTDIDGAEKMFSNPIRFIKKTSICDYDVSSVFLGIDHALSYKEPLLFETLIFYTQKEKYPFEDFIVRGTTYQECLDQHQNAVEKVSNYLQSMCIPFEIKDVTQEFRDDFMKSMILTRS